MNADQHVPLSALGIDEEALFEGKRAISERQWQRLRDTARLVLPTDVWLAFDAVMDATEVQFVRADWFANDDDGIRALKDEIKRWQRAAEENAIHGQGTYAAYRSAVERANSAVERAEKAERALAELVDVVANRPLDSEQVHSVFIRARDLVKEGKDV